MEALSAYFRRLPFFALIGLILHSGAAGADILLLIVPRRDRYGGLPLFQRIISLFIFRTADAALIAYWAARRIPGR